MNGQTNAVTLRTNILYIECVQRCEFVWDDELLPDTEMLCACVRLCVFPISRSSLIIELILSGLLGRGTQQLHTLLSCPLMLCLSILLHLYPLHLSPAFFSDPSVLFSSLCPFPQLSCSCLSLQIPPILWPLPRLLQFLPPTTASPALYHPSLCLSPLACAASILQEVRGRSFLSPAAVRLKNQLQPALMGVWVVMSKMRSYRWGRT